MFRILIVEDDEPTSGGLSSRLSRKIPEAQVETAMTVKKAHELIESAFNEKLFYDAVVLDIKLPKDENDNYPEMDETVCRSIKELMPADTIVAHISAYPHEPKVKDHIRRMHNEQIDRSFWLSKLDEEDNYVEVLEGKLKSFLYGIRISDEMNRLFGPGADPSPGSDNRNRRAGDERSLTHELAALSRDISAYWNDLDDCLKAKIQRVFEVSKHETKEGEKVIVSFY